MIHSLFSFATRKWRFAFLYLLQRLLYKSCYSDQGEPKTPHCGYSDRGEPQITHHVTLTGVNPKTLIMLLWPGWTPNPTLCYSDRGESQTPHCVTLTWVNPKPLVLLVSVYGRQCRMGFALVRNLTSKSCWSAGLSMGKLYMYFLVIVARVLSYRQRSHQDNAGRVTDTRDRSCVEKNRTRTANTRSRLQGYVELPSLLGTWTIHRATFFTGHLSWTTCRAAIFTRHLPWTTCRTTFFAGHTS